RSLENSRIYRPENFSARPARSFSWPSVPESTVDQFQRDHAFGPPLLKGVEPARRAVKQAALVNNQKGCGLRLPRPDSQNSKFRTIYIYSKSANQRSTIPWDYSQRAPSLKYSELYAAA